MTAEAIQDKVVLYEGADRRVHVEVRVDGESVWLTQKQIAALFGVQRPAVTRHLKNIFESGELTEETTSSILEHMAPHRQTYQTKYYRTCWAKVSHEGRWHDRRTAVSLPQLLCGSGRVSRTRTALCPNTL